MSTQTATATRPCRRYTCSDVCARTAYDALLLLGGYQRWDDVRRASGVKTRAEFECAVQRLEEIGLVGTSGDRYIWLIDSQGRAA